MIIVDRENYHVMSLGYTFFGTEDIYLFLIKSHRNSSNGVKVSDVFFRHTVCHAMCFLDCSAMHSDMTQTIMHQVSVIWLGCI